MIGRHRWCVGMFLHSFQSIFMYCMKPSFIYTVELTANVVKNEESIINKVEITWDHEISLVVGHHIHIRLHFMSFDTVLQMWQRLHRGGWRGRWNWRHGIPHLAWVHCMLLSLPNRSQLRRSWGEREPDHSRHAMGQASPLFLLLLLGTRREGIPSTTDQIQREIDWQSLQIPLELTIRYLNTADKNPASNTTSGATWAAPNPEPAWPHLTKSGIWFELVQVWIALRPQFW